MEAHVKDRRRIVATLAAMRLGAKKLRQGARWLHHAAVDVSLPPTCAGCDVESSGGATFCDECRHELVLFAGPTCMRCGAAVPAIGAGQDGCAMCRGEKLGF